MTTAASNSPAIGPWYRTAHGEMIFEVKRGDETLIFDPANVLMLAGHRIRIVDPTGLRPVMEVEGFDRVIRRYPMKVKEPVTAAQHDKRYAIRCSGCSFRFAGTLDDINRQARLHDDSPQQQHIVLMDPPAVWPKGTS